MTSDPSIRTWTVTFDQKVYSLNVVKKALYRHLQAFTSDISIADEQIHCLLTFASPMTEKEGLQLANELKKEVLDQDLRKRLQAETEAVRNVILAHTFSKTGLIKNEPLPRN